MILLKQAYGSHIADFNASEEVGEFSSPALASCLIYDILEPAANLSLQSISTLSCSPPCRIADIMTTSIVRVCSFESRRNVEMGQLIEKFGGVATVAPSMQEIPLAAQPALFEFADKLTAGEIDVAIFMTGVGTETLFEALSERFSAEELAEKIRSTFVAVRGPKPSAALAKRNIKPNLKAPEPNTWQDLAEAFVQSGFDLQNQTVAIQEYGIPSEDFYTWLRDRGAIPLPVPIYRWELPDELDPLQSAIQSTIQGEFDLLLWTSAQQVLHVLEVAEQMGVREEWLRCANRCLNASIGPTASERLREQGITPQLEPSHPKMAHLVRESLAVFGLSSE